MPRLTVIRAAVAVTLLVALALASVASFLVWTLELRAAPEQLTRPNLATYYQARFTPLRPLLPRNGIVGYVSDRPDADEEYLLTQYALAPLLLDRAGLHAVVIGNFFDPAAAPATAARMGLILLRDLGEGVMLFRGPAG
ncbi:MAG TPA: hypothetical protein VGX21_14815 [Methylomirabilota bacterium]|nr:hypothetical protein [Methylomirabilota bacterium]